MRVQGQAAFETRQQMLAAADALDDEKSAEIRCRVLRYAEVVARENAAGERVVQVPCRQVNGVSFGHLTTLIRGAADWVP